MRSGSESVSNPLCLKSHRWLQFWMTGPTQIETNTEQNPNPHIISEQRFKQCYLKIVRRQSAWCCLSWIVYLHNDVVDGDVNELDKETNESHDGKPNRCGHCNLLKFWVRAKIIIVKNTGNNTMPLLKKKIIIIELFGSGIC